MQKWPVVLYCDFECFVRDDGEHVPSGFALYRVASHGKEYEPYVYSGANVMDALFERLDDERKDIEKILRLNVPIIPLTDDEKAGFEPSTTCSACNRKYKSAQDKYKHHCHITGRYLALMCLRCNFQLKHRNILVTRTCYRS